MSKKKEGEKQVLVRIPDSVYGEIEALAEKEVRSVNGQILVLLLEALKARKGTNER